MHRSPFSVWMPAIAPILIGLLLCLPAGASTGYAALVREEETPPLIHIVSAGDTLHSIALRYGVSVQAITQANRLDDPNRIQIGQKLLIPTPNPAPVTPVPALPRTAPSIAAVTTQQNYYLCAGDVRVYSLVLPQEAIHLATTADALYAIGDGALFQIPLPDLTATATLTPTNLLPVGRRIDGYWVQELVYATVETESGDLLLLDKTNDIYRYTAGGEWRMEHPAAPVPGQFPDPQFIGIQSYAGDVYALDSDLSRIWLLNRRAAPPRLYLSHPLLLTGLDLHWQAGLERTPIFTVLTREGHLLRYQGVQYSGQLKPFPADNPAIWPTYLLTLSDGRLGVVDSEQRSILAIDPAVGLPLWRAEFRIAQMQRLRSAAIISDTLYAVAGPNLYVADLRSPSGNCPPVNYDNDFYFAGEAIGDVLPSLTLPFPGAVLPWRPRSYPGARRLYRYGVHQGLDLYGLDVAGLGIGSPVRTIANGVVVRADSDYVEMTPAQYKAALARTAYEHRTPPEMEDLFVGRQVRVEHSAGVESRYGHLGGVARGISTTLAISQGISIGVVGVSGTSAGAYGTNGGAHLHFEIWIDGRYMGQGLNLEETMRIWHWLFDPQREHGVAATTVQAVAGAPQAE